MSLSFVGVELYFDDLAQARRFYSEVLGLAIDEDSEHHVKLCAAEKFICLEKKGVENYPSADKAVLFFEASDLQAALDKSGPEKVVRREANWGVLHDPEGHNIVLLQAHPKEV